MVKQKKEERKTRRAYIQPKTDTRTLPVRICENIAENGIYAILLLTPVTFLSNSYWPFDIPKVTLLRILTLIVLGGYMGKIIASREWRIVKPPLLLWMPVLLYVAIYAISTIFSISPDLSLQSGEGRNLGLVSLASIVLLYFLVINIITERDQLLRCLNLFVISSSVVALMGILQDYDHSMLIMKSMMSERASATFGNPDFLFAIMILAVPVSYGLLVYEQRWLQKLLYFGSSILLGWCILLSMPKLFGDDLSLLVAVLSTMLILFLSYIPKVLPKKQHQIIAYSSLTAGAILVLCVLILVNAGGVRDNFTGYEKRFSGENTDRYMLAEIALDAVSEYPIIGSGPNTFRNTFTQYATLEYAQHAPERREDKVHNSYVEALSTTGWLGFLTYVFMQIAVFGYLAMWLLKNRKKRLWPLIFWILISGLVYMAHTFFMFHTTTPYTFFWILIAIAAVATAIDHPRVKTLRLNMSNTVANSMLVLAAILTCISVFIAVRPLIANAYYYQAEMYLSAGNSAQNQLRNNPSDLIRDQALGFFRDAIDSYAQTVKWNGSEIRYRWSYAIAILSEARLADPGMVDIEEKCNKVKDTINGAIEREPESGMLYYNRGILMYSCGYTIEDIIDDIDKSIEMYPTGYMARQFRAELNTEIGNLEEAIEDDEMALAVKPENFNWMLRLSNNYLTLGDEYSLDNDPNTLPDELYSKAIDTLIKAKGEYIANQAERALRNAADLDEEQKSSIDDQIDEVRSAIINNDIEQIELSILDLENAMIPIWEEGIQVDVTTLYLLAVAYEKAEQTDKAQEAYQEAIEILELFVIERPKNIEGHYMLGFCYERTGEYNKALAEYETVLQSKPNHERALDGLARIGGGLS